MFFRASVVFFTFIAVTVFMSYWMGFLFLNSPLILVLSALITYLLFKKLSFTAPDIKIPRNVFVVAILIFAMVAYPLLLITPYYSPSADPLHSITMSILAEQGRIPETQAPYADISFSYQIGFPLFAKTIYDFLPFIQEYHFLWFLGAIFAAFIPIFFYVFVYEFVKNKYAAEFSVILLIGTLMLFADFYYGLYPRMLATCMMFLFFVLFLRKNKLSYLIFPAIFCVHPGTAFLTVLFLLLYIAFFRHEFKRAVFLLPSLILAIPIFLATYLALIINFGANTSQQPPGFFFPYFIQLLIESPVYVGAIPFGVFLVAILLTLSRRTFLRKKAFFISAFLLSLGLFLLLFSLFNSPLYFNMPELMTFSALLFIAATFPEFNFRSFKYMKHLKIGIVLFALLIFYFNPSLDLLRTAEKISPEEAEFAFKFREFDSARAETLFLSEGSVKMAELSDKIPHHTRKDMFVLYVAAQVKHDEGYYKEIADEEEWNKIVNENCVECIYSIDVEYVVVNEAFVDIKPDLPLVFEQGNFKVYYMGG